ncbi:MAG: hypothetical protein ACP5IZ_07960 [Thermoprotei archaeon]
MKPIVTVKKDIINDIVELGGKGIFKCYQCGSCTATCAIAEGMYSHWVYKTIANYVGARKGLVRGEGIE